MFYIVKKGDVVLTDTVKDAKTKKDVIVNRFNTLEDAQKVSKANPGSVVVDSLGKEVK